MISEVTQWMGRNTVAHDLFKVENAARHLIGRDQRPPGPAVCLSPINMFAFFEDQLGMLAMLHETYGDEVYMRLGPMQFFAMRDPALIEQVLLKKSSSFHKDDFMEVLRQILGDGLLTSEDEQWRKHRRIAAPALKRKQIRTYADDMVSYTRESADHLRDGAVVDVWEEMMELTLRIVVKTLFNLELPEQVNEIGEAIEEAMNYFDKESHSGWALLPKSVPTPARHKFRETLGKLDAIIYDLIMERRKGEAGDDLLWSLLEARYEDGTAMSTRQIRDEAITMFIAGHETTALATTFAFDQIARAPEIARKLREELDAVLGDRPATLEDVRQLTYTEAIIKETMRLYPPAWIIGRRANEDVQIGPWQIPEGSQVVMSQWLIHRDERHFEDPLSFKPERWHGTNLERELPRFAYFPFGGGPRVCIGNHFAMMEAILVVAEMARRWEFQLTDPSPIELAPMITLRPTGPVRMKVKARG